MLELIQTTSTALISFLTYENIYQGVFILGALFSLIIELICFIKGV